MRWVGGERGRLGRERDEVEGGDEEWDRVREGGRGEGRGERWVAVVVVHGFWEISGFGTIVKHHRNMLPHRVATVDSADGRYCQNC